MFCGIFEDERVVLAFSSSFWTNFEDEKGILALPSLKTGFFEDEIARSEPGMGGPTLWKTLLIKFFFLSLQPILRGHKPFRMGCNYNYFINKHLCLQFNNLSVKDASSSR